MFSPNQQTAVYAKPLSVQVPSQMVYVGPNESPNVAMVGIENGTFSQAESIVYSSKKLENDMLLIGKKIKYHEENIRYLKIHKNNLDDLILHIQATLGKYQSKNASMTEGQDLYQMQNEEAIVENIMRHEKSAAGILCQLKRCHGNQAAQISSTKDILGIVATIGKVDDNVGRSITEAAGSILRQSTLG